MFTGLKLTSSGAELNAYLIANNLPLTVSTLKIGDGNSDTYDRTALANEKMEAEVESIEKQNKDVYVRATFTNEYLSNGFNVREVGLIAIDPRDNSSVLYSYDNAGSGSVDYFEAGNGLVILKEVFEIITNFGNMDTENITLTISPSLVFVTKDIFDAYKSKDIIVSNITIPVEAWVDNEYTYQINGVVGDDLAIVWFKAPEMAANCEIIVETVDGGMKFTCTTVPDIELVCSVEVKKV